MALASLYLNSLTRFTHQWILPYKEAVRSFHSGIFQQAKADEFKPFKRKVMLMTLEEISTERGVTKDLSLIEAVRKRDIEAIKTLSKAKPELILHQDREDNSPLHVAAKNGDAQMIRELTKANPDTNVNIRCHCSDEYTPLEYTALGGHKDAAEALFEAGANPNLKDKRGRTALDMAIENGHHEVALYIYDQGGRANIQKKAEEKFGLGERAKKHAEAYVKATSLAADNQFQSFMEELENERRKK